MKAVILAAGRGSRLKPISDYCHKALLRIGNSPILSWQIHNLSRFGIDEVVVVTGYQEDRLVEACQIIDDQVQETDVMTIHNDQWDTTENLYSVSLTEQHVRGEPLILLNCDIVPEPKLFEQVLRDERDSTVPFDPTEPDEDALQLKLDGDSTPEKILDKGHEDGDGATLGFFSMNSTASNALFQDIENYLHRSDVRAFWFEHSISRLFNPLDFTALDISDMQWFEIDTEDDLINAWVELGRSVDEVRAYIKEIKTSPLNIQDSFQKTKSVEF